MTHFSMVAGVVRDCESTLYENIRAIYDALSPITTPFFYIVESDSNDNTINILRLCKEKFPHFEFITLGNLRARLPQRTERLAYCRNLYVRKLRESDFLCASEYCFIADLDGINDLLTTDALTATITNNSDWAAIFPNQLGRYYDIWALRHEFLAPNDCWQEYEYLNSLDRNRFINYLKSVSLRMIKLAPTLDPISVDSAFGGFAIYKTRFFKDCEYNGVTNDGKEVCEHVSVHKQIKRQTSQRLIIDPKFITGTSNEHSSVKNRLLRPLAHLIKQSLVKKIS